MAHRVAFLDVFAERPLAGNGLAVVDAADRVPAEVMLAFAGETRLAETTFVQTAGEEDADYRNRIFTVAAEIPFAGHPSLGTAVAVARWRGLGEANLVQETEAGLQPIEVRSNLGWHASMLQNEAEFGAEPDPAATMRAVGLRPDDAHPELPPQIVTTGLPTVIVPVSDPSALARPEPDFAAIDELLAPIKTSTAPTRRRPSTWSGASPTGSGRGRACSRAAFWGARIPATGSAAGPLCAYLAERAGCERLTIAQGEEMGRPSVLEAEMEQGRPRVGGKVVPLIEGTVELPGV